MQVTKKLLCAIVLIIPYSGFGIARKYLSDVEVNDRRSGDPSALVPCRAEMVIPFRDIILAVDRDLAALSREFDGTSDAGY